ncbi:MAG: stage II sporulation protein R [Bacillota bacterium]
MKYKVIVSFILLLVLVVAGGSTLQNDTPGQKEKDLIRLHVLANSDSSKDQALKYKVKDAIVKNIEGKFSQSDSLENSRRILLESLPQMEDIARETLISLGSNYQVEAQYGRFYFPTKYYGSFSLPAGDYEAVRVVIGEGKGANWWCVLFPPLCFVETDKDKADNKENARINNSYPINTPDKFKKPKLRVSLKIVEWVMSSLPTLAKILVKS